MKYVPIITSLLTTLASALAAPDFVAHHVALYAILNAAAQVIHALLPSVAPTGNTKALTMIVFGLLLVGLSSQPMHAQLPTNLFAAGISYNSGGTPSVAGTGLYAHLAADSSGTYVFTVADALPNTLKPFTVTTNLAGGIAQKIFTVGKVPIFIPTAAGVSVNGNNTGWAWSTGAMASFKVKSHLYIMPTIRIVKSSVSNGTGYQPVATILFGWGQ